MNRLLSIISLFAVTSLCVATTYAEDVAPAGDDGAQVTEPFALNDEAVSPDADGTWRHWVCAVENGRGMRFRGEGYNRYEARERAMRHCYRSSHRCHLVGCWEHH